MVNAEKAVSTQPYPEVLALCLLDELYRLVQEMCGEDIAKDMVARATTRAYMCGVTPPKLRLLS